MYGIPFSPERKETKGTVITICLDSGRHKVPEEINGRRDPDTTRARAVVKYCDGPLPTGPVFGIRYRTVHGVLAPRRSQTLPKYAAEHISGQLEKGIGSCMICLPSKIMVLIVINMTCSGGRQETAIHSQAQNGRLLTECPRDDVQKS